MYKIMMSIVVLLLGCTSTSKDNREQNNNSKEITPATSPENSVNPDEVNDISRVNESPLVGSEGGETVTDESKNLAPQPPSPNDLLASEQVSGIIYGNGGELLTFQQNPWFITSLSQNRTVTYCVDIDPEQFSLDVNSAENIIKATLKEWGDFYQSLYNPATYDIVQQEDKDFLASHWFATKFKKVSCKQSGEFPIDLHFYLGVEVQDIEKSRHSNRDDLVAFAQLESYNLENFWGKGSIWFVPDRGTKRFLGNQVEEFWLAKNKFQNVLLHELGHQAFPLNSLRSFSGNA